jgi:hypothetical protein
MFQIKPAKDPNASRAHVSIYARKLGMSRVKVTEDIANVSVCWVQTRALWLQKRAGTGDIEEGNGCVFSWAFSQCIEELFIC